MQKILIDARMYGLEYSGIGRYLMNLIKEFQRLDHKNIYTVLLRRKYFDQLNMPQNWKKILADFRHYTIEEQFRLPFIIKEQEPDLVHFPHLNVPIFYRGNFLVTVHDLTMHQQGKKSTTLPLPIYYLKRFPYFMSSWYAVNKSKKIITPSITVKDEIANYYQIDRKKIVSINEGINIDRYKKSKVRLPKKYNIKKPYLIYVGNAYPHKNLEKAISSIKIVNEKFSYKVNFYVGGSKDYFKKRMMNQIRDLGAQGYVKTLGYISDKDLSGLYKHSLGLIYPSKSEGFGLQGLEAMASGTLVLASDIPVFREIYSDNAIFFDPNNEIDIADKIVKVIKLKKSDRKKAIIRSRRFIKKYSWQKMAQETMKIYTTFI